MLIFYTLACSQSLLDSITDIVMSVATHPSVVSTLMCPSSAVPAFQAVLMPPCGAMTISDEPRLCVMVATPSISISVNDDRQPILTIPNVSDDVG